MLNIYGVDISNFLSTGDCTANDYVSLNTLLLSCSTVEISMEPVHRHSGRQPWLNHPYLSDFHQNVQPGELCVENVIRISH